MRFASRAVEVPPAAAVPALVVLQLLAAAALGHGQGWHRTTGGEAAAALLLAAQVALVYAVAHLVAGRAPALLAGLSLVAGPLILGERYFISGGGEPPIDYRLVYRHDVLPTAFGLTARSGLVAACLVLASAWLVLARTRVPPLVTATLGGAAAAAAALVYPHAWPVLAAPVAATLVARRTPAVAATLAIALLGLAALALFRHVPHATFDFRASGRTLNNVREFTWSRRVLQYLPLAGAFGLVRRSGPAGAFFTVALVALVILPLSRPLDLTGYLLAMVPGVPVYWLLAACIPFLVPMPHRQWATGRASQTHAQS